MPLSPAFHSVMPLIHRSPCNLKSSISRPFPSMVVTPPRTKIRTVSPPQLNELLKASQDTSSIIVLKCYASYCHSCRGVEPKYRKIAAAYNDSCGNVHPVTVTFCQMNYALNETFCKDILGAHSLPFFALWKDGEYLGGEAMGWQSINKKLVNKIDMAVRTQILSLRQS
ncbi:hypothetical protein BWQ96_03440 [Gracilariopsis chorda]|uniref:Thioredoxin domain-containing protein n=1 Tax=Gracilariopsis chorda TaxID=448386 RepID=A0A2V3IXC0_9FLOR|nr:hypothetical protein BWQ96_03440 [Gracilariopsis chorda]|eukprot:PXF46749.1 hypothetical protein BWQ96_03440 [Gracilariopsis chorda]